MYLLHCQVNFINLDWWFIAGSSDTCIAEILADTSIGTTCFNTKTKCRLFTYNVLTPFRKFSVMRNKIIGGAISNLFATAFLTQK
jgi:hypothetical protein